MAQATIYTEMSGFTTYEKKCKSVRVNTYLRAQSASHYLRTPYDTPVRYTFFIKLGDRNRNLPKASW